MHSLSSSFVLGYHGCDRETGERLLRNEPFQFSTNDYDWLGSGIYFWEANPDRAFEWARERMASGKILEPFVIGAVIDLGFCLDLISSNGSQAVEVAYKRYVTVLDSAGYPVPENSAGKDRLARKLDCAVLNYLHKSREDVGEPSFDTVRGLFSEGEEIYPGSGFKRKTHVQICVRNSLNIHGVFRVADRYFSKN